MHPFRSLSKRPGHNRQRKAFEMSKYLQNRDLWIASSLALVVAGGLFGPQIVARAETLVSDVQSAVGSSALAPAGDPPPRSSPPGHGSAPGRSGSLPQSGGCRTHFAW